MKPPYSRSTACFIQNGTTDALEEGAHPLLEAARPAGLTAWWGRLTDGSDYHILVGKRIGVFGVENDHESSVDSSALQQIIDDVDSRLASNKIAGTPKIHFQLEAQY